MALLLCFCGLRILALINITSIYAVCNAGCFMAAACNCFHPIFELKWLKSLRYGTTEICPCVKAHSQTVKTLLQISGGWIPQSEVMRTPSDHTAGRRPGSYWREHDDPVNYKGDITTRERLILQSHWDVVKRLSNLLSHHLWEKCSFHLLPNRKFHSGQK